MWWNLPGPGRFLDRVLDGLRRGENVLVLLPAHGPLSHGFKGQVASRAREVGTFEILALPQAGTPVEILARRFGIPPGMWLTASTLAGSAQFRGRVIWLEGLTEQSWAMWMEFLDSYRHALLAEPLLHRTLFVIPLEGELADLVLAEDIGMRHCRWDDVVDRVDMWLFAAHLLRQRELPRQTRDLLVSVIANVALFDPEVALRLSEETTLRILDPAPALLSIAAERNWNEHTSIHWQLGTSGTFQGTRRVHSCQKALVGQMDRRLWRAHVAVLYPEIEEFRQKFVRTYRGQWRVPHSSPFGIVNDEFDLEIGHLKFQVTKFKIRVSEADFRRLEMMVRARHALAHLEKLDPSTILELLS